MSNLKYYQAIKRVHAKPVFDNGYYELPTELDPQLQPMEQ